MHNYYPILWVGAIIGVISTLLIVAAFVVKDGEKETGFERNMKDSEIMQRLMDYAKPFYRQFIVVGFLMLFSIAYDIISPLIVGKIEELVVGKFALNALFLWVAGYAAILLVSMACTYFQAVILQKTGQKIISNMREDLFVHIERLSHEQLNEIPVGKLVTRTTNDTNAISLMFTNLLVNLLKNFFVIIGILIAMLFLNYELTRQAAGSTRQKAGGGRAAIRWAGCSIAHREDFMYIQTARNGRTMHTPARRQPRAQGIGDRFGTVQTRLRQKSCRQTGTIHRDTGNPPNKGNTADVHKLS